jgi:hypothetical protein
MYTATAWIKADAAAGKPVQLVLRERGGAVGNQETSGAAVTPTSAWQQIAVSHTIAQGGRTGLDLFVKQANGAAGDAFLLDDVSLRLDPGPFKLTVTKAGTGAGTVTSSPAGIDCGQDCEQAYPNATSVTLTATPAGGSAFTGWSGACTTTAGTCAVTLDAAKSVTATFAPTTATLTVTKAGDGSGTVTSSPAGIACGADCSETYAIGAQVTLTAAPSQDADISTFEGWGGACVQAGTGPTCTLTLSENRGATARFRRVNAGVQVGRPPGLPVSGLPSLTATLTARDGCGAISHIDFGDQGRAFDNAVVSITAPTGGPREQRRGFTYVPPPGTMSVSLTIERAVQDGGATVNPVRLHDRCGEWHTFVGGGPNAFR